jgi:hypothetical protein
MASEVESEKIMRGEQEKFFHKAFEPLVVTQLCHARNDNCLTRRKAA